jgi:hypothetical protein
MYSRSSLGPRVKQSSTRTTVGAADEGSRRRVIQDALANMLYCCTYYGTGTVYICTMRELRKTFKYTFC